MNDPRLGDMIRRKMLADNSPAPGDYPTLDAIARKQTPVTPSGNQGLMMGEPITKFNPQSGTDYLTPEQLGQLKSTLNGPQNNPAPPSQYLTPEQLEMLRVMIKNKNGGQSL